MNAPNCSVRPLSLAVATAGLVVATLCAWRACLGFFFFSDDFALVAQAAGETLAETLRRHTIDFADGTTREPYFRPAWRLLFGLMHRLCGDEPRGYFLAGLLFHLATVVAVFVVAVRATRQPWISAAAALALAVAPTPVEAVVWPSAAFNVPPCALLLLGSGCALWRWLDGRSRPALAAAFALLVLSFCFKEAGYQLLPLYAATAWWAGKPVRGRRRELALVGALLLATIALHYRFLNRIAADGTLASLLEQFATNAGSWLRELTGAALPTPWMVGSAVAAALALGWAATPRTRFFLIWAGAAFVPYAFKSAASRFSYFFHVPLFLAFALFAADRVRDRGRIARWSATAALAAIAAWNAWRLPAAIEPYRQQSEGSRSALASLRAIDFAPYRAIVVHDSPPWMNGLASLLQHWCDAPQVVQWLVLFRKPPFAIHGATDLDELTPDVALISWDESARGYRLVGRDAVFGDLIPLPLFALRYQVRVVDGPAAAVAAAKSGSADFARTVLLYAEPSPPFVEHPGAKGSVTCLGTWDLRELEVAIDGEAEAFLAVHFLGDLTRTKSEIQLDGAPVEILGADGGFNAVRVPAGRHVVRLIVRGNLLRK